MYMKKRFMGAVLASMFIAGCLSYGIISYQPGTYEGAGMGFRGIVRVLVTVSENGIENIEIPANSEDAYAAAAMEELAELALEYGSADLDVISGATVSCAAFLNALEAALARAAPDK